MSTAVPSQRLPGVLYCGVRGRGIFRLVPRDKTLKTVTVMLNMPSWRRVLHSTEETLTFTFFDIDYRHSGILPLYFRVCKFNTANTKSPH